MSHKNFSLQKGTTLIYLLIVIFIFSTAAVPLLGSLVTRMRVMTATADREEALEIAEAGVNYYQWRLAHFPTDYKDGNATSTGPYLHNYTDLDTGEIIGQYSLTITPPPPGSTIVTISSTGWSAKNPTMRRTVTARFGVPSLAQYAFLSNDVVWIGPGESVSGKMQSNNGIRFDGTGNSPILSAKLTYTCGSSQACSPSETKDGVWGSASQAVKNFWQFPVPAVDFASVTSDFATLKSSAQSSGIYLPPSNLKGYSLVFKDNATIDIYKVKTLASNPTGWDVTGVAHDEDTDYRSRTFLYNKPMPSNGVIYIEDKTWVEGTVNGRVVVAAAILPYNPSTAPTIYIPNNIVYMAKDGSHVLGLLAQDDVVIAYSAPSNLEINAALVAQNGSTQFFYYPSNLKSTINIYGSIMSYGQWTWTWVNSSGNPVSGYVSTVSAYDSNLLYAPPPSFPLSTSGYQQLSWTSN